MAQFGCTKAKKRPISYGGVRGTFRLGFAPAIPGVECAKTGRQRWRYPVQHPPPLAGQQYNASATDGPMPEAIYLREGCHYTPTPWACSPWSPEIQHGSAVNALLGQAIREALEQAPLQPARIHVDLMGPVPMRTLKLDWEFARRGRRTAWVDARLLDEERTVARASALLLQPSPGTPEKSADRSAAPPHAPDTLPATAFFPAAQRRHAPKGFHLSLELREEPDANAAWIRTSLDFVSGEAFGDLERSMALADLTGGLAGYRFPGGESGERRWPEQPLINNDTCLHLERPPRGDWLRVSESRLSESRGVGVAEVVLHDTDGRWGRCLQSLISRPWRT